MLHTHRASLRRAFVACGVGLTLFACQSGPAAPLLVSLTPSVVEQGNLTPMILSGNFDPQVGVSFVSQQGSFVHTNYQVYFGATAFANVTYLDAHTLTATLPADASPGTYDVEVVAPGEAYSHLSNGLAILPAPSLDPNSPSSRAIEAVLTVSPLVGDTNTLFSGDASASTDVQNPNKKLYIAWDWQGTGHFTALGSAKTHRFAQPGTYVVHVVVFDATGARGDAYVTVVVAAAGHLLQVQDGNDTGTGDDMSLRQALSQASTSEEPTVIASARPLRIMLTRPLSLSGAAAVTLQGTGLVLDGSGLTPPGAGKTTAGGNASPCLSIAGDGHLVNGLELAHCDVAVHIDGATNSLANLYVHDSNTAVMVTGPQNRVGPGNHFVGLPKIGVQAGGPTRIFNNIIEGMGDAAIELLPASDNSHLLGNILAHNTTAIRLQAGAQHAHLWNNTLDAAGTGVDAQGAQHIDLRNNILTRLGMPLTNPAAFDTCAGNDFFNNPNDIRCGQTVNNMSLDPQFAATGACGAYTLGNGSPLAQAGVAILGKSSMWVGACGP